MIDRCKTWLTHHPGWAAALPGLLTLTVYAGTLSCQFVFDDIPQIIENPFITNAAFWRKIFLGSVWSFRGAGEHDNFYRPLQFVVYWFLYRLNGPNPAVFHLFQLLLCATTACLVYQLARELFHDDLAALGGALLWALHPQHVETVTWVSALPDAGATFFGVLALLLFLRAEHSEDHRLSRYSLAAVAYFPALLFKESALSYPLLVLVYWFYFPSGSTWKQKIVRWLPFGAALAVYIPLRIEILGTFSQAGQRLSLSRASIVAAFGLLGQHAKLFVWPAHLSAFRVFNLGPSLHSPWPWLAILTLIAALFLRRSEPLLGFLMVWWAVTLAPCLNVSIVSFPVADRFSYMPSVGIALAIAYLLLVKLPRLTQLVRLAPALAGFVLLVSVAYAAEDFRLVPTWGDNVALWSYSLQASPDAAIVHLFQASLLLNRDGNTAGAEREYRAALRLNHASARPLSGTDYECYLGLGQIELLRGDVGAALKDYQTAVQIGPDHAPAYKAIGAVYFPEGHYDQSAKYFVTAVKLDPQDVESKFFLGTCELKLGHPKDAAAQFRAARVVDPTYIEAYAAEAHALDAAGDAPEAARVRLLMPKH